MTGHCVDTLPPPIVVACSSDRLEDLLGKEWLLTNRVGAYASSTVVGCNTRRYHGLLVAATKPPVGRIVALSTIMEQLVVGDTTYHLATNEFLGSFSPCGVIHLAEFRNDVAATFVFRAGPAELIKEVILAEGANAVAVRYTLRGTAGELHLWPFAALRDFHHLRKVHEPHQMTFEAVTGGLVVEDRLRGTHALHVCGNGAAFSPRPQWWYRFCYRQEIARGQDGYEDLYTPGAFVHTLADGDCCQMTASLGEPVAMDFAATADRRRDRLAQFAAGVGAEADTTSRRLAMACDAFVVQRTFPDAPPSATILAGYHWFADWGRDAFVALPGLLLVTGRTQQARQVFATFAGALSNGMIPNCFDDYSPAAHYDSIDASLWFIIAAERYLQATGDAAFWRDTLMPVAQAILSAYYEGTRFDIHEDGDSLLIGGSPETQLTWMDARLGREVVTPRHGKAVEINALWYNAHRIVADRSGEADRALADRCAHQAELIAAAFDRVFWNAEGGCLYDCVTEAARDGSIRPNQILAVSLPYSPLSPARQAAVVKVVDDALVTPMGLRTLSPRDPRYRRRYGGSWESRDRAYHQGTVWAWLMGPFVEAYLKVARYSRPSLERAQQLLSAFGAHLGEAGLGFISEIFDGDGPHTPRGCIAQAWSVAEVLRVKQLVNEKMRTR